MSMDNNNTNLETKMRQLKVKVEQESVQVINLVDSLVNKYGRELEESIDEVRDLLKQDRPLENEELETIVMQIPVYMYYAIEGLEKLGVEGDNAKAVRKEVFNSIYIDTPGTIEDKTKNAELATMPEYYVEQAFQRAYRKLKEKIEKAEHVYSGAKKILDKRTNELFIQKGDRYNA